MKKMICLLITIVAAIYSTLTVYADYDEWLDVYHDETRYHYMIDVKSIKPLVMKDGSKAIHFNTLINVGDFIDIFYTVTNFTEINVYPDDGMIQARKIRSYPTAHDHVGAVWVMPDFHYLSDYDEHPIIPGSIAGRMADIALAKEGLPPAGRKEEDVWDVVYSDEREEWAVYKDSLCLKGGNLLFIFKKKDKINCTVNIHEGKIVYASNRIRYENKKNVPLDISKKFMDYGVKYYEKQKVEQSKFSPEIEKYIAQKDTLKDPQVMNKSLH
ncbi:MAG: hypothetical protein ACLVHE_03295 [Dialister invisus]|uniref:hypothetical protein n=1 Tax=Dialister invisus TaxID=218538 RepID=UPI0039997C1B